MYFYHLAIVLSLPNSTENSGKELHLQKKVRDVKWSIQPMSVCHCQLGHQRLSPCGAGGGLTQEGRGISSFSSPEGEGIMSENCMSRETREKPLRGCKRCIFHHTVFIAALFHSVGRKWHCKNLKLFKQLFQSLYSMNFGILKKGIH